MLAEGIRPDMGAFGINIQTPFFLDQGGIMTRLGLKDGEQPTGLGDFIDGTTKALEQYKRLHELQPLPKHQFESLEGLKSLHSIAVRLHEDLLGRKELQFLSVAERQRLQRKLLVSTKNKPLSPEVVIDELRNLINAQNARRKPPQPSR